LAKATDHVWERGPKGRRTYYLRVAIPRPIRHLFLSKTGKPLVRVVERLSDSQSDARVMAAERVAVCLRVFAQAKAGLITTPAQAEAALHPGEPDLALEPEFAAWHEQNRKQTRERDRLLAKLGVPRELRAKVDEALLRALQPDTPRTVERRAAWFEGYGDRASGIASGEQPAAQSAPTGETVNQAAEAWLEEMTRDKTAAPQDTTVQGHRLRVRAFVDKWGDKPLTEVTRAMASDFLGDLQVANRTRNNYATTLKCVFECAHRRGRFTGDNPFDKQKQKVAATSYQPFTVAELQKLFDAMPREVAPVKHTPDTAMPWVALIALYTGARLEEIAQLTVADVRAEQANGATVTIIDIHNGGANKLKNESAARLIPVHSALVRAGLLKYVDAVKAKPLFPGLTRRASKGDKVGARVGELFRKKLVALKLKREGLCFHSFRHTVAGRLDAAGVPQSDAARVLGHAVAGMSYGTYSQAGPGLKRVAAVVEQVTYEGLRL
jgi:integrase